MLSSRFRRISPNAAKAAEFPWHGSQEVLRCPQLLEVLKKEPVVSIVRSGALGTVVYHTVGQNELGHFAPPSSVKRSEAFGLNQARKDDRDRPCDIACPKLAFSRPHCFWAEAKRAPPRPY